MKLKELMEAETITLRSMGDILLQISKIIGESPDANRISQALEDYAEKYPRAYQQLYRSSHLMTEFLSSLEEEVDARINH